MIQRPKHSISLVLNELSFCRDLLRLLPKNERTARLEHTLNVSEGYDDSSGLQKPTLVALKSDL